MCVYILVGVCVFYDTQYDAIHDTKKKSIHDAIYILTTIGTSTTTIFQFSTNKHK